jgi:hypothetical protein
MAVYHTPVSNGAQSAALEMFILRDLKKEKSHAPCPFLLKVGQGLRGSYCRTVDFISGLHLPIFKPAFEDIVQ